MSKILITEKQLQNVKNQLIKEDVDNRYSREVEVDFYYNNVAFKGREIDGITSNEDVRLSFIIDMEVRSWGVKDIMLYGVSGPNTLNIKVDYYGENSDETRWDTESEDIDINLDWEKLETDSRNGEGVITIGDTLQITLANDENGNIVVESMDIDIYTL